MSRSSNSGSTEVSSFVQGLLNQMKGRFQGMSDDIIEKLDNMGSAIDSLEGSVAHLTDQASNLGKQQMPVLLSQASLKASGSSQIDNLKPTVSTDAN